jgi:hypothetical protein
MVCRSSRGITVRDPRDPSADNRTVGGTGDGAAETAIHRTKSARRNLHPIDRRSKIIVHRH